ncbi:MAG: ArsA-related P-loop ATPase [Solirubrobacterales bacterium]
MSSSVEELLAGASVCVCAGSGGVGKTTTSAAIAAGMAARGHRVCVLTIDPAKRLADSLGLGELGNDERRVESAQFAAAGVDTAGGELWATMLDAKATFDDVVARHAPDEAARARILGNRIYRQISGALAGSQEYMAMERLYELHERGDYDLLVLDTPPSRNALDFLDAPRRLVQFIEGRAIRLFLRPTGIGMRVAGRSFSVVASLLRRLTGLDLIEDLSEFFGATAGMIGGFRERAARVEELLADEGTSFLIVCGPAEEPVEEAVYLRAKLAEGGLPLRGLIVNRVHRSASGPEDGRDAEHAVRAVVEDTDLAARILTSYEENRSLAQRDARSVEQLAAKVGGVPMLQVPELSDEVHDLAGLLELGSYLFDAD